MRILLDFFKCVFVICILLIMSVSIYSCDSESDPLLIDELDEEYQLYDFYVDECGNEGIVVYILKGSPLIDYPNGYKYIIVLSSDEGFEPWGPMGEIILKKDSASKSEFDQPSTGMVMLQSMNARGLSRYPAQNWCFQKNKSKEVCASSWRLPSLYELTLIFGISGNNLEKINRALKVTGGTLLDDSHYYWTCMEDFEGYVTLDDLDLDYDQANRAILTTPHHSTSGNKDRWLKKIPYHVRAIKYIYYYDY